MIGQQDAGTNKTVVEHRCHCSIHHTCKGMQPMHLPDILLHHTAFISLW